MLMSEIQLPEKSGKHKVVQLYVGDSLYKNLGRIPTTLVVG